MRKILLIVSSNKTGLQYYRQLMPHNHLIEYFEGFEIKQAVSDGDNFNNIPDELLKEFNIVCFLRQISTKGNTKSIIDRCHRLGLKVFFDIDDYWRLPDWHPMCNIYKSSNYSKNVEEAIKYSDVITTTNVWLQNQIKKINPVVFVVKNCCDTSLPQYKKVDIQNRRKRFGWIGGVYHYKDLSMMYADFYKFFKDEDCVENAQLCLGGYTNGQKEYEKIEELMTNNYNLDDDYKKYLLSRTVLLSHYANDKPYKRLYAKGVEDYMKLYNEIDVSLIPLHDNTFNSCKSELKMIEAGVMGKACIVSEVRPYLLALNDNAFVVNKKQGFYDGIKYFLNNPEAIGDYADLLAETIDKEYNIFDANELRCELYNYYS